MSDVICFGEALIDFHAGAPLEIAAPAQFTQYAGGAPANVAVAVARLGGRSAYVGMLGRDVFADFLLQSFNAAGVDTRYVARTAAANTGLAFVSLDAEGERRFSFYRPPAADLLFRPEHFDPACFESAAIFHACSNSLTEAVIADTTLAGMRSARRAGALISFDVNLRLALWPRDVDPRPRIWAALGEADLVKLCGAELAFLAEPLASQQAVLNRLWEGRAALVLVTDGAAPIRYFTRDRSGSVPTLQTHAVNTNAAGDAFIGGFLYRLVAGQIGAAELNGLCAGDDLTAALRFAAACGAFAVTRHGAFTAMPTFDDVGELLNADRNT
ncbi:MAG TPA: carbohydrate kinase [Gammaproteobacteria bacterium]|nr:carbohydrate kinase [Gammaproteobacteria bacterium]